MVKNNRLYVVDLSNWIHRAYHVAPALTHRGKPVGTLKVFISMAEAFSQKYGNNIVYCTDCPREESWRYLMVADRYTDPELQYKGGRVKDPERSEALAYQLPIAAQMLEAAGFVVCGSPNQEADDCLATLAHRFRSHGVTICTRDKDCAQMIGDGISVLQQGGHERLLATVEDCVQAYGVRPDQIVDYLAMLGDKADNVAGIRGIGEVKARQILAEHQTLRKWLDTEPKCKGLSELVMPLGFTRRLIRLDRKALGLPRTLEDCARRKLSSSEVRELSALRKSYAFSSLFGG